ncbi:MAG: site-2 protease family protein [Halorhabdus sp.]
MIDTLALVVLGVLAYSVVAMTAQRYGYLPSSIDVSGPITTLHTQRGKAFLDRLARHKRFFRAWANVGIGFGLLVMVAMFLTVVFSGITGFRRPEANPIRTPTDALVLPGVNEFLPLSAAPEIVFGLAVAMIVHEGGHGLLCRVEGIDIDSMGLVFLTVLPIGAFVEPDEADRVVADRGATTRMFVAGVTNNFVVTALALLLLFGPVAGSITAVDGVAIGGVLAGSPADKAGLERGDVITDINESTVTLQGTEIVPIDRTVTVIQTVVNGPLDLAANETIVAVGGTPVETMGEFERAIENRTVVTLTMGDGETKTGPIGAYASAVLPDGPLANASAPAGKSVVVTRIGGTRTPDRQALLDALNETEPGDVVPVEAFVNGTRETYNVRLGGDEAGNGFLGVGSVQPGYSGIRVADFGFGIRQYPSEQMLSVLGGGDDGPGVGGIERLLWFITLPFLALIDPSAFGFAGFNGYVTNFFAISGPLGFLGGGVFVAANVLFWTAWINLNVAVFNLIPLFPLDGGHILRTSAEAIVARTPLDTRWVVRAVTVSIGLLMFASLAVMLFGPMVLT